jgi:hypothetical protein
VYCNSALGGDVSFVLLAVNPFGGLLVAIPFAILKLHYSAWVATLVGTPLAYVQVAVVDLAWSVLGRWPAWERFVLARRSKRIERIVASGGSFWVTFLATPFVGPWLVMAFMRYAQVRQRRIAVPILCALLCTAAAVAAACDLAPRAFDAVS